MEKNANLHRDSGGSSVCATLPVQPGEAWAAGGGGKRDPCAAENASSDLQTGRTDGGGVAEPGSPELGCTQAEAPLPGDGEDARCGEACSNGPGCGAPGAAAELNPLPPAQPAQLESKQSREELNVPTGRAGDSPPDGRDSRGRGSVDLSEPTTGGALAGGSEPSPSPESLDSSSILNSCPSPEVNGEGLEDRGPASALEEEKKAACCRDRGAGQSIYHIKWIRWKEENTPVITQNENGPCPLLAIMNVLLLAWKVKLPPMMEIITAEQLMEYLGDYILDAKPKEISEAQRLNYEQVRSGIAVTHHQYQTGVKAVGNCSYNQLVEKIISYKQSESSELAGEGVNRFRAFVSIINNKICRETDTELQSVIIIELQSVLYDQC
uniref:Ubiquitin carboxyl-terminal hydrolase n=1 Tax=Astyanax mexicanus TaxID=7994 RepID=A0A8B9I0G4_ASTMX